MRRPRAGFVTPHSGGSGAPPAAHYEAAARSSLDGGPESRCDKAAARLTREGRRQGIRAETNRKPLKRGPGDRKAANGAPEGVVRRSQGAHRASPARNCKCAIRRSIPLAFAGGTAPEPASCGDANGCLSPLPLRERSDAFEERECIRVRGSMVMKTPLTRKRLRFAQRLPTSPARGEVKKEKASRMTGRSFHR